MSDDRIERSIEIRASAEAVYRLVSEPGWWINGGAIVEHPRSPGDPDPDLPVTIVQDDEHGAFAVRTEVLRPPRHAAFRWMSTGAHDRFDVERSTLVEFDIEDAVGDETVEGSGGAVILRVAESGFARLPLDAASKRRAFDDNVEGWGVELAAAKTSVEGP